MTAGCLRIFIDEQSVAVPNGATLREILADRDPALAAAIAAGTAYVTDGVGRRIDPDVRPTTGAIFRVVRSARRPPSSET